MFLLAYEFLIATINQYENQFYAQVHENLSISCNFMDIKTLSGLHFQHDAWL